MINPIVLHLDGEIVTRRFSITQSYTIMNKKGTYTKRSRDEDIDGNRMDMHGRGLLTLLFFFENKLMRMLRLLRQKSSLIERMKSVTHHLTYPIHVIDLQTAKKLVDGVATYEWQTIVPNYWLTIVVGEQGGTAPQKLELKD